MTADTISGRVLRHAAAFPDRVFCHFLQDGRSTPMTWRTLARDMRRIAGAVLSSGVPAGSPVIIMLPHHPLLFGSFLGVMAAGRIPSFMPLPSVKQDPELFWAEHRELFGRIGVRAVITSSTAAAVLGEHLRVPGLAILDVDAAGAAFDVSGGEGATDVTAFLQHSSGTTGTKKGVALTHRAVLDHIERYAQTVEWQHDEVVVSWLPLYHDMGLVAAFLMTAVKGGTLVAIDPFEWVARPETLFDAIERFGGTRTWLPNFAFLHLARQAEPDRHWRLQSMRSWVNCSEPCTTAAFDRFVSRFVRSGVTTASLQVCYAMAETVFAVAHSARPHQREIDGQVVVSCGPPIAGTTVRIVREDGSDAGAGEVGEIAVRTVNLFSGYFKRPELTAARLSDGWFRTGDLGSMVDGEVWVSGRVDDVIAVCGRKYYAHAIEAAVSDIAGVVPGRVVAFGRPNAHTGTQDVVVVAESDESRSATQVAAAIRKQVESRLGVTVQRALVTSRGSLVKTTSGKISRAHNQRKFNKGLEAQSA